MLMVYKIYVLCIKLFIVNLIYLFTKNTFVHIHIYVQLFLNRFELGRGLGSGYGVRFRLTIAKTRPCKIQRFFTAVKMTIFG